MLGVVLLMGNPLSLFQWADSLVLGFLTLPLGALTRLLSDPNKKIDMGTWAAYKNRKGNGRATMQTLKERRTELWNWALAHGYRPTNTVRLVGDVDERTALLAANTDANEDTANLV